MNDLMNNKFVWAALVFTFMNVGFYIMSQYTVNKATEKVIQKLQKEYSPSPYSPGFDPDKVDPDAFAKKVVMMQKTVGELEKDWDRDRANQQ
jgi:hypothetical protein